MTRELLHETAILSEVIEPMSAADAARLDQRIRLVVGSISNNLTKLHALVEEAKQGEIHKALGFLSWTAYLADALTIQMQLGREQRRELVGYLSGEGMPQRAIATVVGTSVGTVNNDLNDVFNSEHVPTPEVGSYFSSEQEANDCLAMAELTDDDFESVLKDAREQGDLSRENVSRLCREQAPETQVVGRDGKSYPRRRPNPVADESPSRKPRRRPITEAFDSATYKLGRAVETVTNLAKDGRFDRNGQQLAHINLWDLKRARQQLDEVIAELEGWWDR